MTGIVLARSAQVSKIARWFKGDAKFESIETQISRFLEQVPMDKITVAQLIAKKLALRRINQWTLLIDRTNWQYGKTYRNLLVVGVLFKNQCIPLIANNLGSTRKCGNSNAQDRIDILNTIKEAFSAQKFKCIIGDREFIGKEWMKFLIKESIPFVLRLKEKWVVINDKDNHRTIPIEDHVLPLMKGRKVLRMKLLLGSSDPQEAFITAFWGKKTDEGRELVIVQHSEDMKHPQREYKKRWKIETCFKHMKSGGFDIESSQIVDEKRFENLMNIVFMCVAWTLSEDKWTIKEIIKSNGFRWLSRFRSGLDILIRKITNHKLQPLFDAKTNP